MQLEIPREVARQYEANITDLLTPVLGRGNFRVSADADIDFSQSKESSVKYGDSHVLSQDETIHSSSDSELAIGIPGALSNRRPDTPTVPSNTPKPPTPATAQNAQPSANPAPVPDQPESPPPKPPDTHRTTNYDIDKTVQFLEHPFWRLRAINVAVLANNPSGKPIPAERIQAIETLVRSAIGAGENRHVSVVDLPFAEEGAPAGENSRPWWKEPWLVTVCQNAALALGGLLVLFGGLFPLLRRLAADQALITWPTAVVDALAAGRRGSQDDSAARTEPAVSLLPPSPKALTPGTDTVRALVANDPARTAQIIKMWLAHDRSNLKQAS